MTTQFMLKELCAQISELADATATENAELVASKEELEVELQQLKRATTAGYGTQRSVTNVNGALNGPPLAICIIDGWRASFAMRFVKQGEAGGRMAGQDLLRDLYTDLGVTTTGPDNDQPPIWTSIFLSVRALAAGLVKQGTSSADEVEGFIKGLGQAHQALVLVDVASKRDVDEKIRAYMATFSRLPQVTRVFFAGGFASPFASIARDVAQNKLVFLRDRNSAAPPAMDPNVPVLHFEDMFVDMSLYDTNISVPFSLSLTTVSASAPSPTPPLFSPRLRTGTNAARSFGERDGMLRSPMSQSSDEEKPIPTINPDLPLNKQIPPPCYLHYLLGKCAHGGICTYEHRYELSDVQLSQLRKLAKGQPCAFAAKGQTCLFDDGCVYGHSCPYGLARCRYLVEDKCRFSREMHN